MKLSCSILRSDSNIQIIQDSLKENETVDKSWIDNPEKEEIPKKMDVPEKIEKLEQAPQENAIPLAEAEKKIDEVPLEKTQNLEDPITKDFLQQIQSDLNVAAEVPEAEDLRRRQLTMRATEKEKAEEQKELQKAKKENKKNADAAAKPKPKGRPRKAEGDGEERVGKQSRKRKQKDEDEDGDATSAASPKPKKKNTQNGKIGTASPKAKAKAKAKRAPRGRKDADPKYDPGMVQDMVDLMCTYHEKPYDKTKQSMHKEFTKGKTRIWVSIYWNRPAGGVKIMEGEKESQKFYFSYCYSSIAVHIYMCNKMAERWVLKDAEWHSTDEALQLFRLLLVSATKAQEEFEKLVAK